MPQPNYQAASSNEAIARARIKNPLVLLADEPTGKLESQRRREIMELIGILNLERGITVAVGLSISCTDSSSLTLATRRTR
jgi:ABC-type ATPase involved in cell division